MVHILPLVYRGFLTRIRDWKKGLRLRLRLSLIKKGIKAKALVSKEQLFRLRLRTNNHECHHHQSI